MTDFTQIKQGHRAIWAMGEFDRVAQSLTISTDHTLRVARIRPGEEVLDVATGTGITALAARERGGKVTGLDLTPELVEVAKGKAAALGYDDISFGVGDAEALPVADASFDVVLSTCGHMFAPDQQKVAGELGRVTKRGGRVTFLCWTPTGGVGRLFQITAKHVPPNPLVPPPFNWGVPEKVTELLGENFTDFTFTHGDCPEFAASGEEIWELFSNWYGPTVKALSTLDTNGKDALRREMTDYFNGYRAAADGKVRWGREYVITRATRK